MTNALRISTATFITSLVVLLAPIGTSDPASTVAVVPTVVSLSAAEQELVDFARSRFELAGIELPEVTIEFDDKGACEGYGGLYLPSQRIVRICRASKSTMVHELAHAWIETVFDDDDRSAFLELRGLERWTGGRRWDERGAEHAAEIITWGLMDEDLTVRWLEHHADGSTSYSWRLFKLPDSDPARLVEGYQQLTGELPALRVLDEACDATPDEITSPEANR